MTNSAATHNAARASRTAATHTAALDDFAGGADSAGHSGACRRKGRMRLLPGSFHKGSKVGGIRKHRRAKDVGAAYTLLDLGQLQLRAAMRPGAAKPSASTSTRPRRTRAKAKPKGGPQRRGAPVAIAVTEAELNLDALRASDAHADGAESDTSMASNSSSGSSVHSTLSISSHGLGHGRGAGAGAGARERVYTVIQKPGARASAFSPAQHRSHTKQPRSQPALPPQRHLQWPASRGAAAPRAAGAGPPATAVGVPAYASPQYAATFQQNLDHYRSLAPVFADGALVVVGPTIAGASRSPSGQPFYYYAYHSGRVAGVHPPDPSRGVFDTSYNITYDTHTVDGLRTESRVPARLVHSPAAGHARP